MTKGRHRKAGKDNGAEPPAEEQDAEPTVAAEVPAAPDDGEADWDAELEADRDPDRDVENSVPDQAEGTDGVADTESAEDTGVAAPRRRINWSRPVTYGVLPGVVLVLALVAGLLKGLDTSARYAAVARTESVQAAQDAAIAMFSYQPDTVDNDLGAARDLLVGSFRDSYSHLIHDVIIPRAKDQRVSANAHVTSASSVSATVNHAVALVIVDQIVAVGDTAPTKRVSSFRVALDKIRGRWLISAFDPV